ncbi:unnamed protein product [Didymodactylos carnosus]|uniref:Uncharacterized protein n=1 Tax=Didymodactylos carnosus TaxID=1234261 RepID=A0A816F3G6_9BILA|nr:unnamed protein product [Didymodactylos carnosus]CAF4588734.1 unnamed protein product [Didymodactylos carnosus]
MALKILVYLLPSDHILEKFVEDSLIDVEQCKTSHELLQNVNLFSDRIITIFLPSDIAKQVVPMISLYGHISQINIYCDNNTKCYADWINTLQDHIIYSAFAKDDLETELIAANLEYCDAQDENVVHVYAEAKNNLKQKLEDNLGCQWAKSLEKKLSEDETTND